MATIIAFGNQKGGTGKSTTTCLAANALSQPPFNRRVFVADCDQQQSIIRRRLSDQQFTNDIPPYQVAYKTLAEFQRDIQAIDKDNDVVFVDLPGRIDIARDADQQEITRFLQYVDFLFIPFVAGNFVIDSTIAYLRAAMLIRDARKSKPRPLHIVGFINMHRDRTREGAALQQEVETLSLRTGIDVMKSRLNNYALFSKVDTFTTFYDPKSNDKATANLTAWIHELNQLIK